MKALQVTAKVPANEKKGLKEMSATITVQAPETGAEGIKVFGDEVMNSNATANWVVTLQGNIRSGLKRGETAAQIATRLAGAKMGVVAGGAKVDPKQAIMAEYAAATPERKAEIKKEILAMLQ